LDSFGKNQTCAIKEMAFHRSRVFLLFFLVALWNLLENFFEGLYV